MAPIVPAALTALKAIQPGQLIKIGGLASENPKAAPPALERARVMAKDAVRCYVDGLKKAKEPISVECEFAQVKISVVA